MINRMIVANVLHRPVRTIVSALAVAIEVSLIILVVGLTSGLLHEAARRVEGLGADVLVQPPGSSYFFGLSQAPMPIKIGDRLAEINRVQAVTPVLFLPVTTGSSLNVVYGIDPESFIRVTGGFIFLKGGMFTAAYDIIVDDWYSKANHIKLGQSFNLFDHSFRVVGLVEHGKGARLFIPLSTAQDLTGSLNKASIFFVKCTDPAYADDVVNVIKQLPGNLHPLSIREYMSLMSSTSSLPGLEAFVNALIAIALVIGFLVIFLSMYTTISERTREIGILKSLGASKAYIIAVILRETGLLCAVGVVLGIVGAFGIRKAVLEGFPTLSVDITADWAFRAAVLAVLGSLVGSVYPALKAASLDPIEALAYE
jgi:putative ABC transport system permease protein